MRELLIREGQAAALVLLFAILLSGTPIPISAQVRCDPTITPLPASTLGYMDRGNRCEGMYVSDVAGAFEVVSFVMGRFDFEWQEDVVLEISPPPSIESTINVRAVAIPLGTYYRMDGRMPPQGVMAWPIKDVLFQKRLNAEKIGIYGRMQQGEEVYVPVRIVQQGRPPDEAAPPSIILGVRPEVDIEAVFWRSGAVVDGACSEPSAWQNVLNPRLGFDEAVSRFRRGEVVPIDVSGREQGELCIEIQAREQRSAQKVKLTIRALNPDAS